MIERYENALQVVVLAICIIITIIRAARFRSRSWTILAFFYGGWMLGEIYWIACLLFYDKTPQISVISDLSWYASYIFLYMLLRHLLPPEKITGISLISWIGPVFAVGMAVFFMFHGEIVSNLIYAGLMGLLLFSAIRRLTQKDMETRKRFLPLIILILCLLEYALWTASCFWNEELLFQPYYVFDILLTLCLPFFLPATKKAVTE